MPGPSEVTPTRFVLRGGEVIDGTGSARFGADVVVDDGRVRLAEPGSGGDAHVVDISGSVVTPGFIDAHSHADLAAFFGPVDPVLHRCRLVQGVTTEITGNCGFSPFPFAGGAGGAGGGEALAFLAAVFGDSAREFADLSTYRSAIEAVGLATNVAPLVGHGSLRVAAMGFADRSATPDELARMAEALRTAIEDGAFGLSSGLVYTPATYAPPDELVQLARVVEELDAVYASHIRNETDGVVGAVEEILAVATATGARIHISHLKAAGRKNWGKSADLVALLESRRASGLDVTADAYPYSSASTMLHSLLPPWLADEGVETLIDRLDDAEIRDRVTADLEAGVAGWQNLGAATGWDGVHVASSPASPEWEGLSITRLASELSMDTVATIAHILRVNGGRVVVVIDAMDESDVRTCVGWEMTTVGSDGIPLPGRPHPRLTGTFPRVLARYTDVIGSLESAVHRMTGATADRFGLDDRGVLVDGAVADVVVFDPATVRDEATYEDPWAPPTGISHVIMEGKAGVWDGEVVNDRLGRVLRSG